MSRKIKEKHPRYPWWRYIGRLHEKKGKVFYYQGALHCSVLLCRSLARLFNSRRLISALRKKKKEGRLFGSLGDKTLCWKLELQPSSGSRRRDGVALATRSRHKSNERTLFCILRCQFDCCVGWCVLMWRKWTIGRELHLFGGVHS